MPKLPRILTIAGSDSSGGAGIQADIKTISALGGYAMTAITAITAQNTLGVRDIHPVPPASVVQQIEACAEDIGIDAIKTGMLLNAEIITAITSSLRDMRLPLILDPVMVATSGARLLDADALEALTQLIPLAQLITPNIPEAEILSHQAIKTRDDMIQAAEVIAALGAKAILLKGGHLEEDTVHDLLWQDGKAEWFSSPRITTRHTHGTGCTLAAALATEIGRGTPMAQAVRIARDYVHQAILNAPELGAGNGPLGHFHAIKN